MSLNNDDQQVASFTSGSKPTPCLLDQYQCQWSLEDLELTQCRLNRTCRSQGAVSNKGYQQILQRVGRANDIQRDLHISNLGDIERHVTGYLLYSLSPACATLASH